MDQNTKINSPQAPPPSPSNSSTNLKEDSTPNRVEQMVSIQQEALELFKKKNQDYGDAFATYGPVGVLVRMGDKIARLQSITNQGITLVNTESIRDTLIDLHNYSAMAAMLIDKELFTTFKKETTRLTNTTNTTQSQPDNTLACSDMAWLFTQYKKPLTTVHYEEVD